MILRRQADINLDKINQDAPEEYDTFVEIANELANIKTKTDKITITQDINLDNISSIDTLIQNNDIGSY